MNNRNKGYDFDKNFINKIKEMNKRVLLREAEEEEKRDAIAITDDPKFGDHVLSNQIDNFKQTVNGGAKFANVNTEDAQSNPLVFFPKTGNLVFTGSIPSLSDLKFQFSLNDITSSPYIFVDGLALTEDVVNTLQKLRGYYLNWRDEWVVTIDTLSKIK